MKPISSEVVEKTLEEIENLSFSEAQKIGKKVVKQQPIIFAYLMAIGDDFLNQDEKEFLIYLGAVVCQIMSHGDTPLPKVTEETLDEVEGKNIKMVENFEGKTEADFLGAVEEMVINHPQPEVLRFVVEELMEEPEEDYLIRDESKGIMFAALMTIIDCLNK